jgi:alkanesulfonate monooxygenase SsuD/methylene tetrahydromethanopterin reductase-like flavin-dependent oxidoreductase (luciferase family)
MKFGFTMMADIDEIGFFSHAESLGYDSVWVTDSQMLYSDCYAALALAARQTTRLRIGPGTAICGTRIPPVQVAAMATLNAALTNVAVLQPGEPIDSDRIKAAIGPNVMASVYYFYDEVHERRIDPPPFLERIWKPYCALVEATPPEHRHFRTHEFHYTKLHFGEAQLIDAQLIRDTCLVGTPDELIERIRELERDGLQELTFATGNDAKWRLAEDFARQVMARL